MGSTVVEALYQYRVDLPNGTKETVSPGDKFTLIKKSNDDWWYVQFQQKGLSVYLPATYLKELNERTINIDVTPPLESPHHHGGHGPVENGSRDQNSLEVADPGIKRRSTAPHRSSSSFKKGDVPRFHHEPAVPEEDTLEVKEVKPARPSQLNFSKEVQKPQHHSPQSPTPDSSGSGDHHAEGWKTLTDTGGRKYYYNTTTGHTQWEPPVALRPRPAARSPATIRRGSEGTARKIPSGWREELNSKGEQVYIHEATNAKWYSNVDTKGEGRVYYYSSEKPGDTRWQLPEIRGPGSRFSYPCLPVTGDLDTAAQPPSVTSGIGGNSGNILRLKKNARPSSMYTPARRFQPNFPADGNLVMEPVPESLSVPLGSVLQSPSSPSKALPGVREPACDNQAVPLGSILHALCSPTTKVCPKSPAHESNVTNRRYSDSVEDISPDAIPLEKEGMLLKLQLTENSKRVKQKWVPCYTTLNGSKLSFYKDTKNYEKGGNKASPTGPPDSTFELYGAELRWPKNDRAKLGRKYAFELSLPTNEILVQGETEEECLQWFQAIHNGICALGPNPRPFQQANSKDIFPDSPEGKTRTIPRSPTKESLTDSDPFKSANKSKIRDKLKSFMRSRPNSDVLKAKGILKEENVFGKRLVELCHKEKSTVPKFILACIDAIDKRGLEVDGIYRVSGNLSSIQKLRFQIDQELPVNLANPPCSDIHVIAGSLKLFFRELPEPLFTFDAYDRFIQCAAIKEARPRSKRIRDILKSLPLEHRETIAALAAHLIRVIEHGDQNRMKAQNVAIVFGPTLMWPRDESFNLATGMIFQNRVMEHILTDHKLIFG